MNAANRGTFDAVNVFNIVCVCVWGVFDCGWGIKQKGLNPMWSVFHSNFFFQILSMSQTNVRA